MHEMSIVVDMLRQLEALAEQHQVVRIEAIELEVGILRQVVPEAMQQAFEVLAVGTPAEGAELTITETTAEAECSQCGITYPVSVDEYLCPQCNLAAANIIAGNDIIIKSLICQADATPRSSASLRSTRERGAAHED